MKNRQENKPQAKRLVNGQLRKVWNESLLRIERDRGEKRPTALRDLLLGSVTAAEMSEKQVPVKLPYLGNFAREADQGFIYSWRGIGKTWLGLLMAKAVSQKVDIGPWHSYVEAPVVYIDGEMPAEFMKSRMRLLGLNNENFVILNHELLFLSTGRVINLVQLHTQDVVTQFCDVLAAKALFIDNLSSLCPGLIENDNNEWDKLNNWLLHLRRLGIMVVMLDHAGKDGQHRGGSKKEDNTFWVLRLTDDKPDDFIGARFISVFEKNRNDPASNQPIQWSFAYDATADKLSVSYEEASPEFVQPNKGGGRSKFNEASLLVPLRVKPEGLYRDQWWEALGGERQMSRASFYRYKDALIRRGRVSYDKRSERYVYQETVEEKARRMSNSR